MKFIYPKLSKFDFVFLRIGGPGLGNLLFPLISALVASVENEKVLFVQPTLRQFKIGPFLRCERDKRFYHSVFKRRSFKSIRINFICAFSRFFSKDNTTVISHINVSFKGFHKHKEFIRNWLREQSNYVVKGNYDLAIHIRLGDFLIGNNSDPNGVNSALPLSWYRDRYLEYRELKSTTSFPSVKIFTDGDITNANEIFPGANIEVVTGGNPMHSILYMAESNYIIGSNSTFSLWAAFLSSGVFVFSDHFDEKRYNIYV